MKPEYNSPVSAYNYDIWNASQSPQPRQSRPHLVIQLLFWFFYPLVVLPVSFSLTLALWICALVCPFYLPIMAFLRYGPFADWASQGDWIVGQNDLVFYSVTLAGSLFGLVLLAFALFTARPWLHFHKVLLRDLGGLNL